MKTLKTLCLACTIISCFFLVACGGGSKSSSESTTTNQFDSTQASQGQTSEEKDSVSAQPIDTEAQDNSQLEPEPSNTPLMPPEELTNQEQSPRLYEIALAWDIPTQRANGTAIQLSEIDGYEIRYQKTTDDYAVVLYISNPTQTEEVFNELSQGDYSFQIATVDTDGVYSEYSEAVYLSLN